MSGPRAFNYHFEPQLMKKQSVNKIWPVYVILHKKNFYQKILWKIWPRK